MIFGPEYLIVLLAILASIAGTFLVIVGSIGLLYLIGLTLSWWNDAK